MHLKILLGGILANRSLLSFYVYDSVSSVVGTPLGWGEKMLYDRLLASVH